MIGNFLEKPRGRIDLRRAENRPLLRIEEIDFFFGARQADIHEPTLFFQVARREGAPRMRENAFFQPRNKHAGKLQALGTMERHHMNRFALLIDFVRIRRERHFLKKVAKRLIQGHIAVFLSHR